MAKARVMSAAAAGGVAIAMMFSGTAWAGGGPSNEYENPNDVSSAVGTGIFDSGLVGFHGTGDTNEEASANVIAQCQAAGGSDCTADEVTNDNLCIVAIADDNSDVVAGGAGVTIEAAREDAFQRAMAKNMPLAPNSPIVISDCP